MTEKPFDWNFGLHLGSHPQRRTLAWTEHGWGWRLPKWLKQAIVRAWNRTYCLLYGHDDVLASLVEAKELGFADAHCVDCCALLISKETHG